jgi:hypothetical protein
MQITKQNNLHAEKQIHETHKCTSGNAGADVTTQSLKVNVIWMAGSTRPPSHEKEKDN